MITRMIFRKAIALAVAVAMLDSSEALKWQKRNPDAPNSVTSFSIGAHAAVLGTTVRMAGRDAGPAPGGGRTGERIRLAAAAGGTAERGAGGMRAKARRG